MSVPPRTLNNDAPLIRLQLLHSWQYGAYHNTGNMFGLVSPQAESAAYRLIPYGEWRSQ